MVFQSIVLFKPKKYFKSDYVIGFEFEGVHSKLYILQKIKIMCTESKVEFAIGSDGTYL